MADPGENSVKSALPERRNPALVARWMTHARRWWLAAVVVAAMITYTAVLAHYVGAYAGGCDTTDYLTNARLISQGMTHTTRRVPPGIDPAQFDAFAFVPYGTFRPVQNDKMAAIHPFGLSAFVCAVSTITGWNAGSHVTMVLFALAGVFAMAMLARAWGLSWKISWIAGLFIAINPLYLCLSVHLMSDVPAMVCDMFVMLFAWKSREKMGWAWAAGAMFAIAIMVRLTNIVMLAPVALCLGISWRRWLRFVAAGLPGAAIFFLYNRSAYGNVLAIGYETVGSAWAFTPKNIVPNLKTDAAWLPVLLTPLMIFLAGLVWLAWRQPFKVVVLVVWVGAIIFGFSFFCVPPEWWQLRYLLPAFPACVIGAFWVVEKLSGKGSLPLLHPAGKTGMALLAICIVGALAYEVVWSEKLGVMGAGRFHAIFPVASRWAKNNLPSNAVIIGREPSGSLYYYTSFTLVCTDDLADREWELLDKASIDAGFPLYAALLLPADSDAILKRGTGKWTQLNSQTPGITFWRYDRAAPPPAPTAAQ